MACCRFYTCLSSPYSLYEPLRHLFVKSAVSFGNEREIDSPISEMLVQKASDISACIYGKSRCSLCRSFHLVICRRRASTSGTGTHSVCINCLLLHSHLYCSSVVYYHVCRILGPQEYYLCLYYSNLSDIKRFTDIDVKSTRCYFSTVNI